MSDRSYCKTHIGVSLGSVTSKSLAGVTYGRLSIFLLALFWSCVKIIRIYVRKTRDWVRTSLDFTRPQAQIVEQSVFISVPYITYAEMRSCTMDRVSGLRKRDLSKSAEWNFRTVLTWLRNNRGTNVVLLKRVRVRTKPVPDPVGLHWPSFHSASNIRKQTHLSYSQDLWLSWSVDGIRLSPPCSSAALPRSCMRMTKAEFTTRSLRQSCPSHFLFSTLYNFIAVCRNIKLSDSEYANDVVLLNQDPGKVQ